MIFLFCATAHLWNTVFSPTPLMMKWILGPLHTVDKPGEIYLGLGQLKGTCACGPGRWCPLSALLSGSLLFHWRVEFSTSCSGSKPWKAAKRIKQFMIFHSLCLFYVGGAVSPSAGHPGPTSALTNQTFRCLNATVSAALLRLLGSSGLGEVRARSPLRDPAKDLALPYTNAIVAKQLKLKQRTQFTDVDRNHGYAACWCVVPPIVGENQPQCRGSLPNPKFPGLSKSTFSEPVSKSF